MTSGEGEWGVLDKHESVMNKNFLKKGFIMLPKPSN